MVQKQPLKTTLELSYFSPLPDISSVEMEAELIFTRQSSSEPGVMTVVGTSLSPHQFAAKEDERVPRRFSQQQKRILR